jgi:predicted MFS family arabinose efflux permease
LLSPAVEVTSSLPLAEIRSRLAPETKSVIARLTALFSLDAFGGGFLTDALVAYWFFRRFGIAEHDLGFVFFAVHVLNAGSHLGAAWLAHRIGLVNTMVFTHIPSSLFLIAVPFAPSLRSALVLFLCREALVEMDVPTRQSYVAAMVNPAERTLAAGVTNLARNVFWATGSAVAGFAMQAISFGAPLLIGGGAKVLYDLLLYRSFRQLKAPEERN